MAYPDHAPLMGPGSPPRTFNGPTPSQLPHPTYAPRPMPPPSPNFPPRYNHLSNIPATLPSPNPTHDARAAQAAQTRPGSSMSIMSMLGSEPERPHLQTQSRQQTLNHHPSSSATSMSLGAVMSPPQNPVKTNPSDYTYKPRSQTPDRMGYSGSFSGGTRPYRSSSGTMMQRPSPFDDPVGSQSARPPFSRLTEHMPPAPEPRFVDQKPVSANHSRRSSINAILGPQDAAPQPVQSMSRPVSNMPFDRYGRPEPDRPEAVRNGLYGTQSSTNGQMPGAQVSDHPQQQNGNSNAYDTRPPGFGTGPVQASPAPRPMDGPSYGNRRQSQPDSPETRRRMLFAGITGATGIAQTSQQMPYTQEQPSMRSQVMARQDSSRSQNDPFGDRSRRRFSPFATSAASQSFPNASAPPEDRNRKGSDESSQHRAILGLAADSKRGRYSPLPQAVHGAQAQTPTPDAGIKDEHGRVFSGLGSGIMSNASTVAVGPPGLSASPFKRDEGVARLSEDNLMKISRSTPGVSKRPRKMKDEEDTMEDGRRLATNGRGKRSKYSHYNLNGEELRNELAFPRQNTPSALNFGRNGATPTTFASLNRNAQAAASAPTPIPPPVVFKPRTTIKINSIIRDAARKPRKHLGFFLYNPVITPLDNATAVTPKREIQIEPNVHPAFDVPEHTNCTYTIRVSRTWLRKAEREAICTTRAIWGSGIYADDTDPVAAAIHSGFIRGSYGDHIDAELLEKIYSTQNPKIDAGLENVPATPVEPPVGKDCQITLVVLPPLDTYNSSVRYGLKSRKWPQENGEAPHDGVSFMVLSMKWVDDRSQRGKSRRGEVLKRRIKDS